MKKLKFSTELSYVVGLVLLSISAAFMTVADFGLSMVVAPAYLLHLKLSQFLPFFSFGMAEYTFQALLLVVMIIVLKKFKPYYLFSFVTAVLYGLLLDGALYLMSFFTINGVAIRIVLFVIGMVVCSFSIALLFKTYIAPEVYELFVKEISIKYGKSVSAIKTVYDAVSCVFAVVLSFCFFGLWHFEGVNIGTVVCAVANGPLIGLFSRLLDKRFEFTDAFPLRKYFE